MQRDTSMAQAETLREWAREWCRHSVTEDGSGSSEIAFLLRRCAGLMDGFVGIEPPPEELTAGDFPHAPEPALEARDG